MLDVFREANGSVTIRGYVPSADSFSSNTTIVQLASTACNLQATCTASTAALNGPSCRMYPVDMSFAGDAEGLVTDRCATAYLGRCQADTAVILASSLPPCFAHAQSVP